MAPAAQDFDQKGKGAGRRGRTATLEAELAAVRSDLDAAIAARKAIDAELRRALSIIDHSWSAVITVDAAGRLDGWNEGAERIYGYSAAEMLGQSVESVVLCMVPPELSEEFHRGLHAVRLGRTVPRIETTRIRKDGQRIRVMHATVPLFDAEGVLAGFAFVCDEGPALGGPEGE